MIWFACKKCGKKHSRPESAAGTLVFCDCSFGNRVPWASTIAEPPPEEAPKPIPLPAMPVPTSMPPLRRGDSRDEPFPGGFPRRRREVTQPDPRYCLNHQDISAEQTCSDCKAAFCAGCVVALEGKTLCGPCKNFRIRGLTRPARVSSLAVVSLVVGLISGPVTFCLSMVNFSLEQHRPSLGVTVALGLVSLIMPLGVLVLAWLALRETDAKPNAGGRSLALTGAACGVVGVLWTLAIGWVVIYLQTQG